MVILTAWLAKLQRSSTWYGNASTVITSAVANLLLVGRQSGASPPFNLCLAQAALIYSAAVLYVWAARNIVSGDNRGSFQRFFLCPHIHFGGNPKILNRLHYAHFLKSPLDIYCYSNQSTTRLCSLKICPTIGRLVLYQRESPALIHNTCLTSSIMPHRGSRLQALLLVSLL